DYFRARLARAAGLAVRDCATVRSTARRTQLSSAVASAARRRLASSSSYATPQPTGQHPDRTSAPQYRMAIFNDVSGERGAPSHRHDSTGYYARELVNAWMTCWSAHDAD